MKKCPFCFEEIQDNSIKCEHCGEPKEGVIPDSIITNELPKENVSTKEIKNELTPVSVSKRLLNLLLDYAGIALCAFVLGILLGIILVILGGYKELTTFLDNHERLVSILCAMLYYLTFEALFSRTPGKFITGTKVVDMEGKKPHFVQILIRTLARFLPFEVFSFLGKNSRGWHDRLSKTMVVKTR